MPRRTLPFLVLLGGLTLALGCRDAMAPEFGGLAINIVGGSTVSADVTAGNSAAGAPRLSTASFTSVVVNVQDQNGTNYTTSLTLNGNSWTGKIDSLPPGTYTVAVVAFDNGDVSWVGGTSGVKVQAGATTTANINSFFSVQPSLNAIASPGAHLSFEVAFDTQSVAQSYQVEWSKAADFSQNSTQTSDTTPVIITVSDTGTYHVRVRGVVNGVPTVPSAAQTVTIKGDQASVTSGDTATSAGSLGFGTGASQHLTGLNIAPVGDVDWFAFSACLDDTLHARVDAQVLGSALNAALALYDSTGANVLAQNADSNGTDPALNVALASSGTFALRVSGQNGTTGYYELVDSIIAGPNNTGTKCIVQPQLVTVTPDTATLVSLNQTTQLTAQAFDPLGGALSSATFTWSSSDSSVATVSATGLVTAVKNGVATITANADSITSSAIGAAMGPAGAQTLPSASATITVAQVVTDVAVTPASKTIDPGTTQQYAATATDAGGSAVPNVNFFWVSSDQNVAIIDTSGLAHGIGGGTTTVSAVGQGQPGNATLAVTGPPLGQATQLAFSVEPASTTAGTAFSPAIEVAVRDTNGNLVVGARNAVTLAFSTNAGSGTLYGTKTVNANGGVAKFTGLYIDKAATGYTLAASASGLSGATSSAFDIAPGTATHVAFGTQPSDAAGNAVIGPAVKVGILDQFNNVVPVTTPVTVSLAVNPWKSIFGPGAALFGTVTVNAVSGVATFSDLRVDKPGTNYRLGAEATGLTQAVSQAFAITLAFQSVATADYGSHTCGTTANGTYCWGSNGSGELGGPTGSSASDSVPVLVRGGLVFTQVAVGTNHSCGLTAAGGAYCWGAGGYGQLGDGGDTNSTTPVAVAGSYTFSAISAGWGHTCGLVSGAMYCWGYNYYGELGDGTQTAQAAPILVADSITFASVNAGYAHTCGIKSGTYDLYCWGYDYDGELGDGTTVTTSPYGKLSPVKVGTSTWQSVSAGLYHTCGIVVGGTGYCWGANTYGQLGDNTTTTPEPSPTTIYGGLTWADVTTGYLHTCGIITGSGGAYCWGDNGSGELGDNKAETSSPSRVAVSGGFAWSSISASYYYSCGLVGTKVYCWGTNGSGQLGDGTRVEKDVPTAIVQ